MKYVLRLAVIILGLTLLQSCTKTESDFSVPAQETISINASTLNVTTGTSVSFLVSSSINNNNVTTASKIYVNGALITGSNFTFTDAGNYAVYASKGTLNSNVITVNVAALASNTIYKHRVLVEEYSGTWCGNCPRILYGIDLLHQQTSDAIVVGTHLFNGDPFITPDGDNLAALQGITGVPTGNINRTTSWNGPQYENVNQVVGSIQASSATGIAINSTVSGSSLNVTVKVSYTQALSGNAKLTVYLVEDKLIYTQRNYSANLYNGQADIPNFEYNGVLRKVISSLAGDDIPSSGSANEKAYTVSLPANISNISNVKIVAFVTDGSGTVANVQEVKAGEDKAFEVL